MEKGLVEFPHFSMSAWGQNMVVDVSDTLWKAPLDTL